MGGDDLPYTGRASRASNLTHRIPEAEVLAHIRVTMFAGADTTSAALCRAAQMLAEHQDVQDAFREEIINAGATALTDPGSLPRRSCEGDSAALPSGTGLSARVSAPPA